MAVQTITYDDKQFLNQNSDIADVNKCNDIDLNEIKRVVNNNANNIGDLSNLETADVTNIVNSINSLTSKILWTNPNPTSRTFAAQTITLSSDDYDVLEVFYNSPVMNTIYTDTLLSTKFIKGYSGVLNFAGNGSSGGTQYNMNFYRQVNRNSDTSFSITSCVYYWGSSSASNDAFLMPQYIIGYKTGLFN